jgi:NADPH-dependent glutamate synthase beta subunit-like oxidoreductase
MPSDDGVGTGHDVVVTGAGPAALAVQLVLDGLSDVGVIHRAGH